MKIDDLSSVLATLDPFVTLSDAQRSQIERHARVTELKPNQILAVPNHAIEDERYYFVLQGQLAVTRSKNEPIALPKSHAPNPGRHYLLPLAKGDFFSDAYLAAEDASLTCVAVLHSALIGVPASILRAIMRSAPSFAAALEEKITALRQHEKTHHKGELHVVQDFYLQHNFAYATTMKVIELDRCIGCDGCERACADRHGVARLIRKGPVLGRLSFAVACRTCVDHRCFHACGFNAISVAPNEEVKINQNKCVGCAACFSACPNNVITMQEKAYTAADFPEPMPWTDLEGRTNVPGLFLVGEATGAALIKVAINGGRKAVEVIASTLSPDRGVTDVADVAIAGAGPAGLSAGLTAMELGLNFLLFDKGHFANTIQTYPRNKVVMAEPAHIPLYGNLWLKDTTKEELIGHWRQIIEKTNLPIRSYEEVSGVVRGEDGIFTVTTPKGTYRARNVIMAVGVRGTPRKLGVAGEAEPRVRYVLTDPEEFRGKHVLVVGGGDSAVEAAMTLADESGTKVTLSYRRDSFGRIKQRNQERIDEYSASGKVTVILESSVKTISEGKVSLKLKEGSKELPNDTIIALLGAEPPTKMFEQLGIEIVQPNTPKMSELAASRGNRRYASKCDHCSDYSDQACISACPTGALLEIAPGEIFGPAPIERGTFKLEPFEQGLVALRAKNIAGWVSLIVLALAALVGAECFLEAVLPEKSLLAFWLRSRGISQEISYSAGNGLGYALGISGTTLMVITALYPFHSRLGALRKIAETRLFLAAHIFAGLLGPVLVSYHTMLKLDRWPSIAFWLMWLVVLSGALGRHVYTWLRRIFGEAVLDERAKRRGRAMIVVMLDRVAATATLWRRLHLAATLLMFLVAALHIATAMLFRVG